MKLNYYDVARMANTMAITTTIVLDPTQITVRVKNSIKKQLRQGRITGGWRSEAAKIAEMIVEKFELPVARDSWRGVQINNVPRATKDRLMELVDADWAAALLDNPGYGGSRYYVERHNEARANLLGSKTSFFLAFHDDGFLRQAREELSKCVTPMQRERIEKALDVLDSSEPIHIFTHK